MHFRIYIYIFIILGMFASQSLFLDCILHGPGLARVKALCARPTSHYMGSIQHVGYQLRFSLLFNGHMLDAKWQHVKRLKRREKGVKWCEKRVWMERSRTPVQLGCVMSWTRQDPTAWDRWAATSGNCQERSKRTDSPDMSWQKNVRNG